MLIISAKYLLTMESEPMLDGAIAIENGEIIDVGREEDLLGRFESAEHEDFPNHVLMPGLINTHTHLDMSLHKDFAFDPVRSLTQEGDFVHWLISCIDHKKKSNPDRQREAVEVGIEACIESGTTCVGDMGNFEGIFQCLEQSGLRAVIFPEVLSYDSQVAKDLYETAFAIVEKYMEFDSDLVNVGIGPYSPYTLSRNILKIMAQYCRSSRIPLMIHAAESFAEMEFFYNSSGSIAEKLFPNIGWGEDLPPALNRTPIQYLDEIQFFQAAPILVGCITVTDEDIGRIHRSKAKVVWCPRSYDYLKLGQPPIEKLLNQGILVGLGTDGISSTNTLSLWDEMRAALELSPIKNKRALAKDLLAMATRNGAQVLGIEAETGSLTRAKRADYIIVEAKDLGSLDDIYLYLVQQTRTYHIHRVAVAQNLLKMIN